MSRDDEGSVLLWVPLLVGLVAWASWWLATGGATSAVQARAQSVADLAALAAVEGGPPAAGRVARQNGATVLSVVAGAAGRVTVRVRAGATTATAAAQPEDPPVDGSVGGDHVEGG